MRIQIELTLDHVDGTGRDDAERITDFIAYRALDVGNYTVDAGERGEAKYVVSGHKFIGAADDAEDHLPDGSPASDTHPIF